MQQQLKDFFNAKLYILRKRIRICREAASQVRTGRSGGNNMNNKQEAQLERGYYNMVVSQLEQNYDYRILPVMNWDNTGSFIEV
jgi:hypothetical protein